MDQQAYTYNDGTPIQGGDIITYVIDPPVAIDTTGKLHLTAKAKVLTTSTKGDKAFKKILVERQPPLAGLDMVWIALIKSYSR